MWYNENMDKPPVYESYRDLRDVPLHVVTGEYGVEGLKEQFLHLVDDLQLEPEGKQSIEIAMNVAMEAHDGQMRGPLPYSSHLLRVASRIIKHFGVTEPHIIRAALLHDSVEDVPGKLTYGLMVPDKEIDDIKHRPAALQTITDMFGEDTAELVANVTNPEFDSSGDTQAQYREHVAELMREHPEARVIKLSDFIDNCKGLNHNERPLAAIQRLARKYYPLIETMREFALAEDTPIPEQGKAYINESLDVARERCEYYISLS